MTDTLTTPHSSLRLDFAPHRLIARFACEDPDWRDHARRLVDCAQSSRHPAIASTLDVADHDSGLDVTYALPAGWAPLAGQAIAPVARAAADVADALSALATVDGGPVCCGPFVPGLVVRDATGTGLLVAAGLWHAAYSAEAQSTGRGSLRHWVYAPEKLQKRPVHTSKTEVHFLAQLVFRLLTDREPYAAKDMFAYMHAVRDGSAVALAQARPDTPPALADIIDRSLDRDPQRRPELSELAAMLRAVSAVLPSRHV